jgi:hypothetical protein
MKHDYLGRPWQSFSGHELLAILESDKSLSGSVTSSPGVYMWKLNPGAGDLNPSKPEDIIERLQKITTASQGKAERFNHHSLRSEISVAGNGLQGKEKRLSKFVYGRENAKWMLELLDSLSMHLPSLYVGQTNNLATRLAEHLRGGSDFSSRLVAEKAYSFEDLNVYILVMDGAEKELLEAIEHVVSVVTIAGFTKRVG